MAQQFGGTIAITDRITLAAALAAAGFTGSHALKYLLLRTSDTVAVYMTEDGVTEPGTPQVETQIVIAAAGITTNGNAKSTVTAAGMTNSPKDVVVAVNTVTHTTAALIAQAFRVALAADVDVAAFFSVGGTGATITLTALESAANDVTMNFTVEDDTSVGISDDTSSTNTTAGALNAGILIDDKPLEMGDGSSFVVDSGLTWLYPASTANIEVVARD